MSESRDRRKTDLPEESREALQKKVRGLEASLRVFETEHRLVGGFVTTLLFGPRLLRAATAWIAKAKDGEPLAVEETGVLVAAVIRRVFAVGFIGLFATQAVLIWQNELIRRQNKLVGTQNQWLQQQVHLQGERWSDERLVRYLETLTQSPVAPRSLREAAFEGLLRTRSGAKNQRRFQDLLLSDVLLESSDVYATSLSGQLDSAVWRELRIVSSRVVGKKPLQRGEELSLSDATIALSSFDMSGDIKFSLFESAGQNLSITSWGEASVRRSCLDRLELYANGAMVRISESALLHSAILGEPKASMSHETALTVIDSALVDVAFAPDLSLGEFRFRIDPSEKPFVQEGYVWDPNSGIPEPPPGSVLPDWLIRDSRLENVRFWVEAAPDSQSVPEKLEALAKDFSALLDRQGNCGSGDLAVHPETRGGLMNLVAPPAMAIALKLTPCPEDGGAHAEIYDWCAAKLGNVLAETLQRLPPTESRVRNLDVETYIVN